MMVRVHWIVACFLILLVQICEQVHNEINELMLHHIFGTRSRDKVPSYWLDHPAVTHSGLGFFYDVTIDGKIEKFWMEPKNEIVSPAFHTVVRHGDNSSLSMFPHSTHCLYQGYSLSHNGSSLALTGCGNDKHGLVVSAWGEYYLIQPKPTTSTKSFKVKEQKPNSKEHVIHKRSAGYHDDGHTCLFDSRNDPYPEDRFIQRGSSLLGQEYERMAVMKNDGLTIELAVFADDALWQHFHEMYGAKADAELHKFILAAVNNIDILYTQRSIQPQVRIRIVRYEVMKTAPPSLSSSAHSSGDVDHLLDAFCQYQHNINPQLDANPKHWDHALLFSGYDLYRDNLHTVAGYAPVKGMCSGLRSCTINEGLDFGSVFVVTHEMGHSLGMYHDGDNQCDLRCCIMSPWVGSGKTSWSSCSVYEMTNFIGNLGSRFRPPNCLLDSPIEAQAMVFKNQDNPGQIFTLNEQCEIFHGECWKHELKDGQLIEDVCSMVWCGNGEGVIRTAHPALEGTYCGWLKQCRSGLCVSTNQALIPVNGDWSAWNDRPAPLCGGYCTKCEIKGQIRVRRSIRQCNQPSANNGGYACRGDEARGLRCSQEVCDGISVKEYARKECTKVRDDPSVPNPQFTGEGMQFEQAMCKVWCLQTLSSNIRTISNFPDGTPCGNGKYCIKGECRPLLCSGSTISEHQKHCPIHTTASTNSQLTGSHTNTARTPIYKQDTKNVRPMYWNSWSGWSEWSTCIARSCDSRGVRVRVRRCLAGKCRGETRQRDFCNQKCRNVHQTTSRPPSSTTQQVTVYRSRQLGFSVPPTATKMMPNTNVEWTPWSVCSVSCGIGKKLRRRKNCFSGRCVVYGNCDMGVCPQNSVSVTSWDEWAEWSPCSASCGIGTQIRRRKCPATNCIGSGTQGRRCFKKKCEQGWSGWSAWSQCTVTCGNGTKYRKRECRGKCEGFDTEAVICNSEGCPSWRSPRQSVHNRAQKAHFSSGSTGRH